MASITLYPPTLNSIAPAFISTENLEIEFALSTFSSSTDEIKGLQFSIVKQETGMSVLDEDKTYCRSGIYIKNMSTADWAAAKVDDNLYKVSIAPSLISGGWVAGTIYKIQMRVSSETYSTSGTLGESSWIVQYADCFSEWSTYCTTKAIIQPVIQVTGTSNKVISLASSSLRFLGSKTSSSDSENLYSYEIQVQDNAGNTLEESGVQYTNAYRDINNFDYLCSTHFDTDNTYKLIFSYKTINLYEESIEYTVNVSYSTEQTEIELDISESDFQDEETGRISLSLKLNKYTGTLYVIRASSKDNFKEWSDIFTVTCYQAGDTTLYDYSIESGIWYKYEAQELDSTTGLRKQQTTSSTPIIREFDSAFLLGKGQKQLKLPYDNTMNSYTYTYSENKIDTIGGQFPIITRNGNMKYRTFPVNGLISFNMDAEDEGFKLFLSDEELYNYEAIANLYNSTFYKNKHRNEMYNMTHEREFREKVLAFLSDGKPKLFKSPTEGNVLIRLLNVNFSPNQSVDRLIGSFTATAYEIAEANINNIKNYDLINATISISGEASS